MNLLEKDAQDNIVEQIQQSAIDIVQPVMEQSMIFAAEYAKACGRDTVLGRDLEYAMKYCAMNEVGKKTGSYFPEMYEEDEESCSEDDLEIIDECDEEIEFERYAGRA